MNSKKSYKKLGIFSLILCTIMIFCYISAGIILSKSNIDIFNLLNRSYGFNFNGIHSSSYLTFDDSDMSNLTNFIKEPTKNIDTLVVDFISPDLKIENWDKNYVQINLIGDSSKIKLSKSLDNRTLSIKTKYKKGVFNNLGNLDYKLEIFIPKNYGKNLTLNSQSSDITLESNNFKSLNISSTSGYVNLKNVTCPNLSIKTISADINGKAINCSTVDSSSVSGSINIDGKLKSFIGKSVSGDISLTFKDTIDSINTNTTSGEISINAPKNFSANLELSTVSGDIQNSLKLKTSNSSDHKLSGTSINNSNAQIQARTVSADIILNEQ